MTFKPGPTSRIAALVLILCGFILGIGLFGIARLKEANSNVSSLLIDRIVPVQEITNIRYAYSHGVLLTAREAGNKEISTDSALHQIEKAEKAIENEWTSYKLTLITEREKEMLHLAEIRMDHLKQLMALLKEYLRRGDTQAIKSIANEELNAGIESVVYELNNLVGMQIDVSKDLVDQTNASFTSTRTVFYYALAVSLILASLLSVIVIEDNRRSLNRLEAGKQALMKSEDKWRSLIKYAGDAIFVFDQDQQILEVNDSAGLLTGYSAAELKRMKVSDLVPAEEQGIFDGRMQLLKKDKQSLHERKILRKDGSLVDTEINARELGENGFISLIRDITERKRNAEILNLLASIIQYSEDAIVSISTEGIITSWNRGAQMIFGYTSEEVKGKHISVIIPPDRYNEEDEILAKIKIGKSVEHFETKRVDRNGKLHDISLTVSPIKDISGKVIGASKIARNITEKKKAEAEIQKSEAQYRFLFDHVPAFIMLWDLESLAVLKVNEAIVEKYGYSREEWQEMTVLGYRPAEDHGKIKAFAKRMLSGENPVSRGVWRHLKKNGEVMHMEIASHRILYEGRQVIFSLGRDVTDELKMQEEIKQSEEKFRGLVDQASDAIFMVDYEADKLLNFNESTTRLLGYAREELFQMKPSELFYNGAFEFNGHVWMDLYQKNNGISEQILKRKDGTPVYGEFNTRLLDNNAGFMTIVRDITDRRKTEQVLRAILDYSPENLVLLDQQYKIMAFNKCMQDTLRNYFKRDIRIGDDYRDYVIAPLKNMFLQSFDKARSGEVVNIELETPVDKLPVWFEYKLNPVYDREGSLIGVSLAAKDITERKQAEMALRESEEKFRTLVEQSPMGVFILKNDRIIYANPGFEIIAGYAANTLLKNISLEKLIHENDLENLQEKLKLIASDKSKTDHFVCRIIRADGELLYLDITLSSLLYEKQQAIIGTAIDITDKLQEEKRIAKAVTNAQEQERLQLGMELHDNVKQILAGSLLYLDLLKDKLEDRDLSFRFIRDIGSYLKQAIEELRRLSHRLAPSIEQNIPLADKIKELIDNMNVAGGLAVSVNADKMQDPVRTEVQLAIYRIVQEQFNNILRYAKACSVEILINANEEFMQLSIKDDGVGFDPTTKKEGIGLENIRRRVHMLSGTSRIISSRGHGCNLLVDIPL